MSRLEPIAREIAESFLRNEVVVFHGAGLSIDSGIPAAGPLREKILKRIADNPAHYSRLKSATFPFELLMQTIGKSSDLTTLLEIYQKGKPNTNHRLFAKLAEHDLLKHVVTTNIDPHTEDSMVEVLGGDRVNVCWNEETFRSRGSAESGTANVFKPHGTVKDEKHLGITLREVARGTLIPWKTELIRSVFSGGFSKRVLVLGYSCSDAFDISPAIRSVKGRKAEVLYVENSRQMKGSHCVVTPLGKGNSSVFAGFPGKRIVCNTRKLIEELWVDLEDEIGSQPKVAQATSSTWKKSLDKWLASLDKETKCRIAAELFQRIHEYGYAVHYFERGLKAASPTNRQSVERFQANLLWAYTMHDLPRARRFARALRGIRMKDQKANFQFYSALGLIDHKRNELPAAIRNYERALSYAMLLQDDENIAFSHHNLANGYASYVDRLGKERSAKTKALIRKAVSHTKKCIAISSAEGWPAPEARAYLLLGQLQMYFKEWKKAARSLRKARKLSWLLFEVGLLSICIKNQGDLYFDRYQEEHSPSTRLRAIRYYKEAGSLARQSDREYEGLCHLQLARLYKDTRLRNTHASLARDRLSKSPTYSERLRFLSD